MGILIRKQTMIKVIAVMALFILTTVIAQSLTTVEFENISDAEDDDLRHMIASTLAGGPPGEIAEPSTTGAREGHKTRTFGITYMNYQFYWKFVCSFTKWIPSDQFLATKMEFDP